MSQSDQTEQGAREQGLKQLKAEHERLQTRVDTMYLDRLDGRISAEFFDSKSKQWREEQKQIEVRMRQLETVPLRTAAEAVQIIGSVSDTCRTFQDQPNDQQRAITQTVMEKAAWKSGQFEWTLKTPFQILQHSNSVSRSREKGLRNEKQEIEIWLLR